MRLLLVPATGLAAVGAWFATGGIASRIGSSPGSIGLLLLAAVAAISLHAGWLIMAARPGRTALTLIAWLCSAFACISGLQAESGIAGTTTTGLLIEGSALLFASAMGPARSWADRLAGWRRGRAGVAAQLDMSSGLLGWCMGNVARLVWNPSRRDESPSVAFLARWGQAGVHLPDYMATRGFPETLRQQLLTEVDRVRAAVEVERSRVFVALEQEVLSSAARCRDLASAADTPGAGDDAVLGAACESLLLSCVAGVCAASAAPVSGAPGVADRVS